VRLLGTALVVILISSLSSGERPIPHLAPIFWGGEVGAFTNGQGPWNFCSSQKDYQSGTKLPHSKGSASLERKNILMPEQNANEIGEKDWPHAPCTDSTRMASL